MRATEELMVPRLMESTESTSGISLCLEDLLTATRALDLKEIRRLPEVVPVIILLSESSVRGQTARAQTTLNRFLGKVEATKVLRVFRNPSEQWKTQNMEVEFLLGRLTVNFVEMSAHDNGEPVVLTTMEFKALQYFVQNPRRVISRGELLNQVWGYENYPRTRTVDNHILRLRQKLEENPSRPMHIRTVHGAGYKFLP